MKAQVAQKKLGLTRETKMKNLIKKKWLMFLRVKKWKKMQNGKPKELNQRKSYPLTKK